MSSGRTTIALSRRDSLRFGAALMLGAGMGVGQSYIANGQETNDRRGEPPMPFAIQPGQTIVFIGDSITDWGRRADHPPLGIGYPRLVNDLILARYPDHHVKVVNSGVGSDTVRNLVNRWTDDVIRHQPHWISILIGINDVHRWLEKNEKEAVSPQQFAEMYATILRRVRDETKAKLVMLDPFYASKDASSGSFRSLVLRHLPKYTSTVQRLAEQHGAIRLQLHETFQRLIDHHAMETFLNDPVHPHATGHMVIADAWMKALGDGREVFRG